MNTKAYSRAIDLGRNQSDTDKTKKLVSQSTSIYLEVKQYYSIETFQIFYNCTDFFGENFSKQSGSNFIFQNGFVGILQILFWNI
jgi:hypothetical protein